MPLPWSCYDKSRIIGAREKKGAQVTTYLVIRAVAVGVTLTAELRRSGGQALPMAPARSLPDRIHPDLT
jgi:hypothetical protein